MSDTSLPCPCCEEGELVTGRDAARGMCRPCWGEYVPDCWRQHMADPLHVVKITELREFEKRLERPDGVAWLNRWESDNV